MAISTHITALAPIIILLVGTYLTFGIGRFLTRAKKGNYTGIVASLVFFIALLSLLPLYQVVIGHEGTSAAPDYTQYSLGEGASPFRVLLRADGLGVFVAFVAILMGLLTSIYSIKYMEEDTGLDKFFPLLILMVTGVVGIAFSGDIFNIWVFFELMAISSYSLVSFRKAEWGPVEAGFKYIIMSAAGSSLALLGISILFSATGTLDLSALWLASGTSLDEFTAGIAVLLIVVGFGVKAALVPMHTWLPDAHSAAPSGISAMLSGIVIEAGLVAMFKVLLVFNTSFNDVNTYAAIGLILCILAVITMFVGNIIALVQTDIKRMLAYSSIVQMGYIVLGLGLGLYAFGNSRDPTFGLQGGLFHILTHAFMKGLAFLAAGAFIHAAGTRDMRMMKGLGQKMPITAMAFVIAALSLAGVPPLAGFMSKWLIFRAGIDAGLPIFTAFAIINSILSLGYYIPAINKLYSAPDGTPAIKSMLARVHEASPLMIFAIAVMAGFTIVLGILPGLGLNLVEPAARLVQSVLEKGY